MLNMSKLRHMKETATGIEADVLNYVLGLAEDSEDEKVILNNIINNGIQSGMVNHLIYTNDINRFYNIHENEILEEFEYLSGIYNVDSAEGIDELSNQFGVDDYETRINDAYECGIQEVADDEGISFEEVEESIEGGDLDLLDLVQDTRYYKATELEDLDRLHLVNNAYVSIAMRLLDQLEDDEEQEQEDIGTVVLALDAKGAKNTCTGEALGEVLRYEYSAIVKSSNFEYLITINKPLPFGWAKMEQAGGTTALITEDDIIVIRGNRII